MFRRFSTNFAIFSIVLDAVLVVAGLSIASHLRPLMNSLPFSKTIGADIQLPVLLYPVAILTWVGVFLLMSVYDGRKNLYVADELTSITIGSILASVSFAGTLYLTYRDVSRLLFITASILIVVLLISWRFMARAIFRINNGNSVSQRKVLIIGAGPVGRELQQKISQNQHLGLNLVGFLDDDLHKRRHDQIVLGPLSMARQAIITNQIQDIVFALPPRAYEKVSDLVAKLHDLPVKVWVIPDYFHLALHKAVIEEFAELPMLDLRAPALNEYQRMMKRAFDLLLTVFLLPPVLPLMGLISLLIRIDSRGSALFRQQRVGENGRLFKMLKFRTMVNNAEGLLDTVQQHDTNGNLIHKSPDDPRVTRVGRLLRRTSLDELPQLFNVLKGDMSLVGPRPEQPFLVERYQPWQRKRFAVPQGITGWWQVNGRSNKPMHLSTEDDLYYVQNYSLGLDLAILIKTVWVVFRGSGAF